MPAPNDHLRIKINELVISAAALISDVIISSTSAGEGLTELDSHTSMCVLGKHCFIISESGRNIDVEASTKPAGGLNHVPIDY